MDNYYDERFGEKVNHMRDKLNIEIFKASEKSKLKSFHSSPNTTVNIVK